MNSTLGEITHTNHGVFSRAEALDCGESDFSLGEARRAGLIVRLRRGMYVPADVYAACDESGKHVLRPCGPGRPARPGRSHRASAAALHGFTLYGQDLTTVHILRLDQGSSRQVAKTNHHMATQDLASDLIERDGLIAVSPARAVWEVASARHWRRASSPPTRRCTSTNRWPRRSQTSSRASPSSRGPGRAGR